ncbi:hypothetical protein PENTCL1PPCAC_4548 [Pristionchus entomophagus]|uniref:G protein-coupled receptor n=1 Tax=Pristionchus entomophagus TaxID=358040 RepID=A0AAV5SJS2_9BILA|nr:hypothetical protein PENTCL1PPCAC_4548 [Pristionchus entomophagus]
MTDFYQIVDIVTKASVVPGICLNLLLIFLVRKFSRLEIGTFRYLLIVFASYDIFLIILHFVFDPKYFVLPGIFCAVLDFPYGSTWLTLIHCVCFMLSYAILITHILYRYWVIHKPYKIELFSSPRFVMKLVAPVIVISALLTVLCHSVISPECSPVLLRTRGEFIRKFGRDLKDGWVIAEYWTRDGYNLIAVSAALAVDIIGIAIVTVVISLAALTYRHISAAFSLSTHTRTVQMQLLKAVCVQTFIPLVCVAIPYFCNTTLPIFGCPLPLFTETSGIAMSLFPSWDPLAVIMLMRPYRVGLRTMIMRYKENPVGPISTDVTESKF